MKTLTALAILVALTTPTALAQELDGRISGVVVDATGRPVADQRVELRRRRDAERLVATTDMNGAFTYTRLRPGRYQVELTIERRLVKSPQLELSKSMMQVSNVTLTLPQTKIRKERSELAKLLIFVGVSAGVGVAALVIAVVIAGGV